MLNSYTQHWGVKIGALIHPASCSHLPTGNTGHTVVHLTFLSKESMGECFLLGDYLCYCTNTLYVRWICAVLYQRALRLVDSCCTVPAHLMLSEYQLYCTQHNLCYVDACCTIQTHFMLGGCPLYCTSTLYVSLDTCCNVPTHFMLGGCLLHCTNTFYVRWMPAVLYKHTLC
jgi:hypothetical protein